MTNRKFDGLDRLIPFAGSEVIRVDAPAGLGQPLLVWIALAILFARRSRTRNTA